MIAFQSQLNGDFQLMTITLRDGSVKQWTNEGSNEDPSWAPTGDANVIAADQVNGSGATADRDLCLGGGWIARD